MSSRIAFMPQGFVTRLAAVEKVLARINAVVPVRPKVYDPNGEWVYLEADGLLDFQLFMQLSGQWGSIIGPYVHDFALIHCRQGKDPGVWLHHLGNPACAKSDYLNGCHTIDSWS